MKHSSVNRAPRQLGGTLLILMNFLAVTACDNGTKDMNAASVTPSATPASSPVAAVSTDEALRVLAARRVYFAHQSVGGNLVAGLESILAGRDPSLRVIKTREPATVAGPAFVHFEAGQNEDPASKNADFVRMLDARATPDSGVALLKYCYIDVNHDTDVQALFDGYRRTIAEVRQKHPDITVVHVTMPLTTQEAGPKATIKRLLGRPMAQKVNQKRNRFNALLRNEFGRDPVFDLAELESTRPDGSREKATVGGEAVYAMVPAYTEDGGHLGADAQRRFADHLLWVLASAARRDTR